FKLVLDYLYSTKAVDFVNMSIQEALDVLYTARKYMLPELVDHCEVQLSNILSVGNVLEIGYSDQLDKTSSLKLQCKTLQDELARHVVQMPSFVELRHSDMCSFLASDKLNIGEVELFN